MKELILGKTYAHRGYYDPPLIPENSMAAFRRAVEHGVGVEFDVHMIADGSLVIFHDDELERMTGVKGQIEDYDISNLRKLRLSGTDEMIPTFDELLDLFEDTGLPLMVEIKPAGGNHYKLAEAVVRRLERYKGPFAVESFDPRSKTPDGVPFYQAVLLTGLAFNRFVQPDFLAYRFQDRKWGAWKRWLGKKGIVPVVWTIKTVDEYKAAVSTGCIPIFEQITPGELENLKR